MLILRRVPRSGTRLCAGLTAAETTAALAVAHTAAGGTLPAAGWLVATAAVAYGASVLVLRGRVPVRVALPALVVTQLVLHAWLVTLAEGGAWHSHDEGAGLVLGLGWPMLLAHVVAGLVAAAAWLLRRRAVDVLADWSDDALPGVPHRAPAPVGTVVPRLHSRALAARPTRGPPAARAAAA